MKRFILAAALSLSIPASAEMTAGPMPPLPGSSGRDFTQTGPSFKTPLDYGAIGNGKRRSSQVTIANASTALQIDATYVIPGATYTCTSGTGVATVSPAGGLPTGAFAVNGTLSTILPGCGAASANLTVNITSITSDGSTLTVNFAPNASTTVNGGTNTIVFTPQQQVVNSVASNRRLTHNVGYYGAIATTAGSRTVTAPNGTFNTTYDYTFQQEYLGSGIVEIAIPNAKGAACDQTLVTKITAVSAGDTLTLADAPTCTSSATRLFMWGSSLFSQDDVGKSIELLDGGGAIGSGTHLMTTISAVTDPTHITLGAANTTAKTRMQTQLTWGTNDTTAFAAMATAARAANQRYLYIPNGYNFFLSSATRTGITPDAWSLAWCGEGNVFLPRSIQMDKALSRACMNGVAPPVIDNTIVPTLHLRTAMASGSTLKILLLGDSQMTSSYNGVSKFQVPDQICDAFKNKNPSKSVTCVNYAIGGTKWEMFDEAGPSNGNGAGLPNGSSSTWGTWYTPTSNTWASFAQAACPDVMIMKWGFNDQFNFMWGSFWNILNKTQSTTWRTACGKTPDILIATEGPPGVADSVGATAPPVNKEYVMTYLRGFALSGEYTLANGGKVGLIDIGRARMNLHFGWSPEDLIPTRATYTTPPQHCCGRYRDHREHLHLAHPGLRLRREPFPVARNWRHGVRLLDGGAER